MKEISIVIPFYNEEKNVAFIINDILNFFEKNNTSYEIIVVNDGSADGTTKVLNEFKENKNIIVVTHKKNLGYGATLRDGFAAAKGDLIFFTDSDRQFDINDIVPFLEKINPSAGSGQVDFVAGYRKNRKDPFIRKLYAFLFGFSSMIFFGVKIRDMDCAFKLFKSYVLKDMELVSSGALINLEILAKAKKRGYKYVELPVNHFKRTEGKQTGGSFKVVIEAIFQFFLLWKSI